MNANEISIFKHKLFGDTRIIQKDDTLFFVAKDVVEKIGNTWTGVAIKHVPEQWKGMLSVNTPRGTQETTVLSEQGLYFYLGRCDKPAALQYQMWIAGEVVPAIRKTGGYIPVESGDDEKLIMAKGFQIAMNTIEVQRKKIEADAPKVKAHDEYLTSASNPWSEFSASNPWSRTAGTLLK